MSIISRSASSTTLSELVPERGPRNEPTSIAIVRVAAVTADLRARRASSSAGGYENGKDRRRPATSRAIPTPGRAARRDQLRARVVLEVDVTNHALTLRQLEHARALAFAEDLLDHRMELAAIAELDAEVEQRDVAALDDERELVEPAFVATDLDALVIDTAFGRCARRASPILWNPVRITGLPRVDHDGRQKQRF